MKIIIGSDHRGYALKELIKQNLDGRGVEFIDAGTNNGDRPVDYPVVTKKVCRSVLDGKAERGILICGSGVGVSIAANRFPKIYAALCWSADVAKVAREHDNANILVLPADFITIQEALQVVKVWLQGQFLGGKYQARLEMLEID